ncbi:MAG TPA: bifunctional riboflavin kinase/FAD synthetase [Gemmatimonadales bacterium]|nr:bifunctional riboflavin kinase/FAD synthetase [Gemmatimonadales bacterium]
MSRRRSIVTVGSFDGVHLGHRAVLGEIARRGREAGLRSVLVTFDPHPLEVVNPPAAPSLLTVGPERLEILAQTELDEVMILRFDRRLASLSPEEFVGEILIGRCAVQELVIGHDHGFGRGRSGDADTLRTLGKIHGFAVDVVAAVDRGDQHVSSTRIRRAVAGGDLDSAAALLGRPYSVSGMVVRGAQRGRTIGVPTINLAPPPARKLLPPDGVYAVAVDTPAGRFGGMLNQGTRPTFGELSRSLEAHLFGFDGDLYDRSVRIDWIGRIRDVRRFASAEELKDQLARDRASAEAVLAAANDTGGAAGARNPE